MRRIILKGGLGNQLFQYAHGRMLELSGKKVVFDTVFYNGGKAATDTPRDLQLFHFNIGTKARFSADKHPLVSAVNRVFIKIGAKKNGFWQSERYFKAVEVDIRKEFCLKNPMSVTAQKFENEIRSAAKSVSLHIRRGDYVRDNATNKYWGTCGLDYYDRALAYLTGKIGRDMRVFVFSDDIAWVKENLSLQLPVTYVSMPEIPDYEELILMSRCSYHIIANSSFSWWGAWLDPKSDKIVIAPTRWSQRDEKNYRDIVPASWVRL